VGKPAQGPAVEAVTGRRVLLVAVYWRTNLTLRQLAPLFGWRTRPRTASSTIWDLRSPSSNPGGSATAPC